MNPDQAHKSRWWHVADRVGATASFLCAIHCAALPFVLALLPFIGLQFLADHRFERGFVFFFCALALCALMLAVPGLLLLILGVTYAEGISIIVHSVLVTIGGLLVASSHFVNLRSDRRRGHDGHVHGPQCVH